MLAESAKLCALSVPMPLERPRSAARPAKERLQLKPECNTMQRSRQPHLCREGGGMWDGVGGEMLDAMPGKHVVGQDEDSALNSCLRVCRKTPLFGKKGLECPAVMQLRI